MIIKTEEQLEKWYIGFISATIRDEMKEKAVPEYLQRIDNIVKELFEKYGAKSGNNWRHFPWYVLVYH